MYVVFEKVLYRPCAGKDRPQSTQHAKKCNLQTRRDTYVCTPTLFAAIQKALLAAAQISHQRQYKVKPTSELVAVSLKICIPGANSLNRDAGDVPRP